LPRLAIGRWVNTMRAPFTALVAALSVALLLVSAPASADEVVCGKLEHTYGPFDYRIAERWRVDLVEKFHFTSQVEMLRAGESATIGGDLSFTLRVFPNHPRALMSMSRYVVKRGTPHPSDLQYSGDCYFDRAIRFAADDPMPQLLFGLHLIKTGKPAEAGQYLDKAAELSDSTPNLEYNLGLGYFDLRSYDKSLLHAKRAYDGGFPLPGLREKLRQVGQWKD
jgi:hypothetical protein